MATAEEIKLDSKGRLIIPSGFRDYLRLKPGSEVLVSLDDQDQRLIITPLTEQKLISMRIGLSDKPGSLAAIAKALAESGIDLVSTESRSVSRGKSAEWRVLCSAKTISDLKEVKKRVHKAGATSFQAKRL